IKTIEGKDKYNAVQVGIGPKKDRSGKKNPLTSSSATQVTTADKSLRTRKVSKSLQGHTKELGTFSVLSEFRVADATSYQRGQKLDVSGFQIGKLVDAISSSKGRGFAG